ncbi:MAG: hypothetical protein QOG46_2845, partial [Pseudonocardiales bacterium]|nr:hypothetical protein [Pseudonocardiales bacterium]
IGAPLTGAIPPLATWPADLRAAVSGGTLLVAGGAEYDGRPSAALDTDAIARFLSPLAGRVQAVAVTSVFAPVAAAHEYEAADVARRIIGDVRVSLSHDIGTIGLLERENATVLNATLAGVSERVGRVVREVLTGHGIEADLFLAQNDGTLLAVERAVDFAALVVGSGPATSMRGAAHLSGIADAVVVDAAATGVHVGILDLGTPRTVGGPVDVGGVRVAVPMTRVRELPLTRPEVDAAAMADAVRWAMDTIAPATLLAVGEASYLVPESLPGVAEVIKPRNAEVAAAIGAALAPVSATAERICSDRPDVLSAARVDAREGALAMAIHAGADPRAAEIVAVEEIPISYLVDPAIRIRVRAAGPTG